MSLLFDLQFIQNCTGGTDTSLKSMLQLAELSSEAEWTSFLCQRLIDVVRRGLTIHKGKFYNYVPFVHNVYGNNKFSSFD